MPIQKFCILIAVGLFFWPAHQAAAATIYLLPEQGTFRRGETVNVDIRVNSEGESINAAQGRINWPANILEFSGASKTGSALNFWLEEPVLSSASTSLKFIGGTTKGIAGGALQILQLKFRALSAGTAALSLSDAAVTASDGKGTNVLSQVKGASYRVTVENIQPAAPAASSPPTGAASAPAVQPVRVVRPATTASGLPSAPLIQVPQYSDEKLWHNYLGEVVALWNVPADVTAAATAIDHSPNTVPSRAESELATGRNLGILADGIWYIHARFRNNIGWGPVAHFRLSIDTKPPLPFEVSVWEGETIDNPTPVIRFKSSDALSGLKGYEVKVDASEMLPIPAAGFTGSFTLPLQAPGSHRVAVKAIDAAGNSVEDSISLEILPIPAPTITFITKQLFAEEEQGLNIKGAALPNINILLSVEQALPQGRGETIAQRVVATDDKGSWEYTFVQPFRNGRYILTAQSQDERGALSRLVESPEVLVKSKPIIQIGRFQLGREGALVFLLILLIGGFSGGAWFNQKRQAKLSLRLLLVKSDLAKVFKLIQDDVGKLQQALGTPTAADDEFMMKRLQDNIKKMEGYLKKEIERLK